MLDLSSHSQSQGYKSYIYSHLAQQHNHYGLGLFFLVSSISLVIVMLMFVFIWQPIWTAGFKDFHTITNAINELNQTARPASETVPLMLDQMVKMNTSMIEMKVTMHDMHESMNNLEKMTPQLEKMNSSIENMTYVLSTQMGQMTYLIDKMENKFSPSGMMPHNW